MGCFAGHMKVLSTRRENLQVWPCLQQLFYEIGARLKQMFTIVEDDQRSAILDIFY